MQITKQTSLIILIHNLLINKISPFFNLLTTQLNIILSFKLAH